MKTYQRYIILLYLKNFFIIFFALEFFYVGVDFITNFKDLPDSANLQVLYIIFNFMVAVNYVLPISIIFAMIITKFYMIRSNELVSMYALGISKNALIKPVFFTSLFLVFIYYVLNLSQFAYAYDFRSNILDNAQLGTTSSELFLKHNNKYIYIEQLDPYKQEASNIKIFDINNNELARTITADRGFFKENNWFFENVQIINKPIIENQNSSLEIERHDSINMLEGFRPSIIENAHQGTNALSILDAIEAINFFKDQNININSFKSSLYLMIFFPLYAPLMVLILYYYLPVSGRFFNLALMSFIFIFVSLAGWGVLFVVGKFSANSVIIPEIGIIVPILFLAFYGMNLYRKNA